MAIDTCKDSWSACDDVSARLAKPIVPCPNKFSLRVQFNPILTTVFPEAALGYSATLSGRHSPPILIYIVNISILLLL